MKEPKLKDYKYLNDIDLSRENPKEKRLLIVVICFICSWPWVMYLIIDNSDFFDSDLFGNIIIIVLGLPFVVWGARRVWINMIKSK